MTDILLGQIGQEVCAGNNCNQFMLNLDTQVGVSRILARFTLHS